MSCACEFDDPLLISGNEFIQKYLFGGQPRQLRALLRQYTDLTGAEYQDGIDNPGTATNGLGSNIADLIRLGEVFVENQGMDTNDVDLIAIITSSLVFEDYTAAQQSLLADLITGVNGDTFEDYLAYVQNASAIVGVNALAYFTAPGVSTNLTDVYIFFGEVDDIGNDLYTIASGQASPEFFTRAIDAEDPGAPDGPYVDLATAKANAGL